MQIAKKPPLEVFCLRCKEHHILDAAIWAHRHLRLNYHAVIYFDVEHLDVARYFGVPVEKLLR